MTKYKSWFTWSEEKEFSMNDSFFSSWQSLLSTSSDEITLKRSGEDTFKMQTFL